MSDPTDQGNDWVADYVASYHYRYAWFMLIFPLFGLFFEWKTYSVRVNKDTISRGSLLHSKTFPLSDVDLVQHIIGGHNEHLLYIRHWTALVLQPSRSDAVPEGSKLRPALPD